MTTILRNARMAVLALTTFSVAYATSAQAAEVRLLSSAGIKPVIDAIKPQYERATGNTLTIKYVLTPQVSVVAEGGEPFDVAITAPSYIETLSKKNVVAPESVTNIAKFDLGVGIRAGAPKPDISTPDALKRMLLATKSIAYVAAGATGPMITGMLDKLGIAAETKDKLTAGSVEGSQAAVANGNAEMTVLPIPLIKEAKGVELAGALPAPFKNTITMTAAINSTAKNIDAARALVKFLISEPTHGVLSMTGYDRIAAAQ